MKTPKFNILTSRDGQYYFTLTAPNSKVIATSETYKTLASCKKGIASVRRNAEIAEETK